MYNTNPIVLDEGEEVTFYCAGIEGRTTLTACEEFCPRYSSCDTAGMANNVLAGYNAKGLLEIIEAAGCSNYAELVNLLYEIGTLADKQCEMGRIIEALDEIDSTPGY